MKQREEAKDEPQARRRRLDQLVRPRFIDHAVPAGSLLIAIMQLSVDPMGDGIEWWINVALKLATAFLFCLIAVAKIMRSAIAASRKSNIKNHGRDSAQGDSHVK